MFPERKTDGNTDWFFHDRFGLFIHWGLYAMPARHEWVKSREQMSEEKYATYFDLFDPDLYDPESWADVAARAGMKYFVITTKHHDGFCLWDSKYTDYNATNTPYGKDLLRPMVEAFRSRGLRVGFYHSLIDWHHPHYTIDWTHPRRNDESFKAREGEKQWERYREYLHNQVRELLTDFGKIDILWFDFTADERDGFPGKTRDSWLAEDLIGMIRELQPEIILNDRLQIDQDLKTPEQFVPWEWVKVDGQRVVWEGCHTFSGSWGYHLDEQTWKSPEQLVKLLIDHVSLGGNLLMNVGPDARGRIDRRALAALGVYDSWMETNSRSIYGCTQAPADIPATQGVVYTYDPERRRLYAHIYSWPFRHLRLNGLGGRVRYAQFLHDASEVEMRGIAEWQQATVGAEDEHALTLMLPVKKPEIVVPTIELYLNLPSDGPSVQKEVQ